MKKKILAGILTGLLAVGVLAGCGGEQGGAAAGNSGVQAEGTETGQKAESEGKGTITVAASATPHSEILEQAKPILAEQGWDLQVKVFEEQIRVSEELKKPLIIHCVRAWEELIAIRKKCAPSMPWIIHGFRKKGEQAEQLLKQGFYLSFGEHFQESALRKAWPERLLIETDESSCPIQEIYQHIAAALQISVDELGNQVELTVHRLLPIL